MAGGLPANRTVNGVAVDPHDPKILYAATRDGLFKSTNGGETWKLVGKEPKNLAAVTVNPKKPSELFAATLDGIIFKSADEGVTWESRQR
ncbi:MAG TPA: hypothetical protein VJO34_01065 [Methylomirabilota bacterium]|nr:hypothetical protein [Methylomirabilota bacterium]